MERGLYRTVRQERTNKYVFAGPTCADAELGCYARFIMRCGYMRF